MQINTLPKARGIFHPVMTGALYGFLVLVFLLLADELSVHYGLGMWQRAFDDFCGALIAALLVYRYEHTRSKHLSEKLKTIEMMNHHVRNALQVIVDSVYVHGHAEQLEEISNSVKRIDCFGKFFPGGCWMSMMLRKMRARNSQGITRPRNPSLAGYSIPSRLG